MNIKSMVCLLLVFYKLIVQIVFWQLRNWWSDASSSIRLNSYIISSRLCLCLNPLLYLHIRPRLRLDLPYSYFWLILHIARILLYWRFRLSKSLLCLRAPVFNHLYPLLHFLDRGAHFLLQFQLRLVIDGYIVISTIWGFLFGRYFLSSVVFSAVVSWVTFTFFKDSL